MKRAPIGIFVVGLVACLSGVPAQAGDLPATDIARAEYRGPDDLLTAGLGALGLQSGTAPSVSSPPTDDELRRLAIWANYRALVDTTSAGGFGVLYGPLVPPSKADPSSGKVFGVEYLAYAPGRQNVTMMVQLPDSFDTARPCLVAAASSLTRGIYGAIGTAGEWALKNGCAVAYTDKGAGVGAHNLHADTVNLLRGGRADAMAAGGKSNFTAPIGGHKRRVFDQEMPYRFALKAAHSGINSQADWDQDVLDAIVFGFWVIGEERAPTVFTSDNTLVIAAGVSAGGESALRAAELAQPGLIDAVVASEPSISPTYSTHFVIQQGHGSVIRRHSRPIFDYVSWVNVLQTCANLAPGNLTSPFNPAAVPANVPPAQNRCRSLWEAHVLTGAEPSSWPQEAQDLINQYGLLPEQNLVAPAYSAFYVPQGLSMVAANGYVRASVTDNLCEFSIGAVANGVPIPLANATEAVLFGLSNGAPGSGGLSVINNANPDGALLDQASTSPTFGRADLNLDGALCLRSLVRGDEFVIGRRATLRQRLAALTGVRETLASGKLNGIPTIVVHGRSDGLAAPNHSSRPYYALSRLADGVNSRVTYWEVTNAQHLDPLNALPGFNNKFVPLQYYFHTALDGIYGLLKGGGSSALPPSQVIRTVPRSAGEPITSTNVPLPVPNPGPNAITFSGPVLSIPD